MSSPDLATTLLFGPDIVPGSVVGEDAITKLRSAVNAMRTLAGLSAASFTDSSVAGALIRTLHIQELRTALTAARSALALPSISYADQPLTTSHPVRAMHISQLQEGVE